MEVLDSVGFFGFLFFLEETETGIDAVVPSETGLEGETTDETDEAGES